MSSQILPLHQTSYLFLATRMGKRQTSLNPGQLILRYIVAVANPPPPNKHKKIKFHGIIRMDRQKKIPSEVCSYAKSLKFLMEKNNSALSALFKNIFFYVFSYKIQFLRYGCTNEMAEVVKNYVFCMHSWSSVTGSTNFVIFYKAMPFLNKLLSLKFYPSGCFPCREYDFITWLEDSTSQGEGRLNSVTEYVPHSKGN